jgi:uncharacterized protein (DUF305 family)
MPTHRLVTRAAGALVLSLALAACGANTGTTTNPAPTGAPIPATAQAAKQFNDADVRFAQMMIPHHQQAIAMADLAADRAQSPNVKTLAQQIKSEQDPEIQTLTGFLQDWGAAVPTGNDAMGGMAGMDHGDMNHGGPAAMPGMMAPEQMGQLSSANGTAFDRMFLQMMIAHHQGAVADAQQEQSAGVSQQAKALASNIVAAQTQEIKHMQQLLQTA